MRDLSRAASPLMSESLFRLLRSSGDLRSTVLIARYGVLDLKGEVCTVRPLGEFYLQHIATETMDSIIRIAFCPSFGRGKDWNAVQHTRMRALYHLDHTIFSKYTLKGRIAVPQSEEQISQRPNISPNHKQVFSVQ